MTDNEIIKTLDFCEGYNGVSFCNDCPLFDEDNCVHTLARETHNLINRQKAEIERLQKELEIKTQKRVNMYETLDAFARGESKGRKNFAERLRKECVLISNSIDRATMLITIDALLEEMEGEGK